MNLHSFLRLLGLAGAVMAAAVASAQFAPTVDIFNSPAYLESVRNSLKAHSDVQPRATSSEGETLKQALELMNNEETAAAISLINSNLDRSKGEDGSSAVMFFYLAFANAQAGNTDAARKAYEDAVERFPRFLQAHKQLGILEVREGNLDKALEHIKKTVELGDVDGTIFGLLGYLHQRNNALAPAEAAYRQAMIMQPKEENWKRNLGLVLLQQGKYEEAQQIFTELLGLDPTNAQYYKAQANAYLGLNQIDKAAHNFEIIRLLDQADPQMLLRLGDIYMNKEITDLAAEAYVAAIEKTAENEGAEGGIRPDTAINSVLTLASYQDYESAQMVIDAIRNNYTSLEEKTETTLLTTEARINIQRGRGENAAEILEDLLKRRPNDVDALITLADYYARSWDELPGTEENAKERQQLRQRAETLFERAINIDTNPELQARAYLQYGRFMVKQREWCKAANFVNRSNQIDPREFVQSYLNQLSTLCTQRGGRS